MMSRFDSRIRLLAVVVIFAFAAAFSARAAAQTPGMIQQMPSNQRALDMLDMPDEALYALKQYLVSENDRVRVINLRQLLEERMESTTARGRPLENGDAMIWVLIGTMNPLDWDNMLKALDQVWNSPENYYDVLLDVSSNLNHYRAWLGESKFAKLEKFPNFLRNYRTNFDEWQAAQPPRPWRFSATGVPATEIAITNVAAIQDGITTTGLTNAGAGYSSYGNAAVGYYKYGYGIEPAAAGPNAPWHVRKSIPGRSIRRTPSSANPYWAPLRQRSSVPAKTIIGRNNTRRVTGTSEVRPTFNPGH